MSSGNGQSVMDKHDISVQYEVLDGSKNPRAANYFASPELKDELEGIVDSLQNMDMYYLMASKPPKRLLFTGRPGTGKTMAANVIANELASNYPGAVAFMEYETGKYGTPYINQGSRNINTFFETGQEMLEEKNGIKYVIYFFDEINSVAKKRGVGHSEDDKVLEAIMLKLQKMNDSCTNEIFIGATNFADILDDAAIRKGRIDQVLEFKLPEIDERINLLKGIVQDKNASAFYRVFYVNSYEELGKLTEGFSHSDIASIFDAATHRKIREFSKIKKSLYYSAPKVTQNDIKAVIQGLNKEKTISKKSIGFTAGH